MRISDWSSDVCSSDLCGWRPSRVRLRSSALSGDGRRSAPRSSRVRRAGRGQDRAGYPCRVMLGRSEIRVVEGQRRLGATDDRSEEHTSELQSLMRISYAVFCLKKKKHYRVHKV